MNKEEMINILTKNLGMVDYIVLIKYISNLEEENKQLKQRIDKATNLYLKTLAEQKQVDDLACYMFNILEGNVK